MSWTDAITPLDPGTCFGGCWVDDLAEFVGGGQDAALTQAIIKAADGINWIYKASPFDGGAAYGFARSVFNGLTVAVGTGPDGVTDAILTSPDDDTWTSSGNPFSGPGVSAAAAVRASDGAFLLAGNNGTEDEQFAVSADSGASWTVADALGANSLGSGVAVRASDDFLLVVGRTAGFSAVVGISTDGGSTWATADPFTPGFGFCTGCAIRASDGALVVVGNGPSGNATMAISTDSGATWTTHLPFGLGGYAAAVAIRESDNGIIVVGVDSINSHQLVHSTNDGVTWSFYRPFGTGSGRRAWSVAVRVSDGAFLVGGTDGTHEFSISTDSGSTWTTYSPFGFASPATSCAVRSSDDLLVVSNAIGQIAVSSDGGSTWSVTALDDAAVAIAIRNGDGDLLAAVSGGSAAVSSDSGATWTPTALAFLSPMGQGSCVAVNDDNGTVIVGAKGNPIQQIARSTDGLTYVVVASPFTNAGHVAALAYSSAETLWMAAGVDESGNALVASSADDGVTWDTIFTHPMSAGSGVAPKVYRDESEGNWYLLGQTTSFHALAVSADGGATWTELTTPLDPDPGTLIGAAYAMVRAGTKLALAGVDKTNTKQMAASSDGIVWTFDAASPSPFAAGTAYELAFSPEIPLAVVFGASA